MRMALHPQHGVALLVLAAMLLSLWARVDAQVQFSSDSGVSVYNSTVPMSIVVMQYGTAFQLTVSTSFVDITIEPQVQQGGNLTIVLNSCNATGSAPAIRFNSTVQLYSITVALNCTWPGARGIDALLVIKESTPLVVTIQVLSSGKVTLGTTSNSSLVTILDNNASWNATLSGLRPLLYHVDVSGGTVTVSNSGGWGPFVLSDAPTVTRVSSGEMRLSLSSLAKITLSSSSSYPAGIFGLSQSITVTPSINISVSGSTATNFRSALVVFGATVAIPSFAMNVTSSTVSFSSTSSVLSADLQNASGGNAPYSFTDAVSVSAVSSLLKFSNAYIFDIVSSFSSVASFQFASSTVTMMSSSLVSRSTFSASSYEGLSFVFDNTTLSMNAWNNLLLGTTTTVGMLSLEVRNGGTITASGADMFSVGGISGNASISINTKGRVELLSSAAMFKVGGVASAVLLSIASGGSMTVSSSSKFVTTGGLTMWNAALDGSSNILVSSQSTFLGVSSAATVNFSIGSLGGSGTGRVAVLHSSTLLGVTSASLSNVCVSIVNTAVEFTPSSSVGWLLQGPSQSTTTLVVSLIGTTFVCRESSHWDVCRQRWMSHVSTLSPAVNVTGSTLRWGTRQRAIPTQKPFVIVVTAKNRVDLNDGKLGGSESKSQTQTSSPSDSVDFTSSQSASISSPAALFTSMAIATLASSEPMTVSVSPNSSLSAARPVSSLSSQDTRTFTSSPRVLSSFLSTRALETSKWSDEIVATATLLSLPTVFSRQVWSPTVAKASTSSNLSLRFTKSTLLFTTSALGTSDVGSGYRSPFLFSTHSLSLQCLLPHMPTLHAVDNQASNLLCQTHLCPVAASSEGATLHVGYDELNAAPSLLLLLNSSTGSGLSAWVRMPSLVTLEGTTIAFIAVNDSSIDASVTVAVLLQRSLSGWPGVADRPYATQRLSLIVSMSCVYNETFVYRNEVQLVVDPRSPPVAAAVGVAMQCSQAVAGVGGAGAVALTVGRLMVSLAVLSCENVLKGRGIGVGVLSVSGGLLAVVDTIMGNALFLVLVGAATVGSGLAVFRWHCAALPGSSFAAFMRTVLRLPHSLFPACAATLPSTVTAIVALLRCQWRAASLPARTCRQLQR